MHASFIPYGKRECGERCIREMEAQKHLLPMHKGDETKSIYIDGQVRVCPFGIYEYVFPKEDKDLVLSSLAFNKKVPYAMELKAKMLRRLLNYKKAPKFVDGKKYLWNRHDVAIIPIGVRYDRDTVGDCVLDDGFTHEAI